MRDAFLIKEGKSTRVMGNKVKYRKARLWRIPSNG